MKPCQTIEKVWEKWEQEKETVKKDVSAEKGASTLEDERKRLEEVLKKYKRD